MTAAEADSGRRVTESGRGSAGRKAETLVPEVYGTRWTGKPATGIPRPVAVRWVDHGRAA